MWFDSWSDVIRTVIVGAGAYGFLVIALLMLGKRTLSQMNAFDFVVTVALGSILATILLTSDVSWTEGAAAMLLLAGLQFIVAWLSTRFRWFSRLVTSQPVLLVSNGQLDRDALAANRLTESQVLQAVRGGGYGDVALVGAVVLEPNGKLSVISHEQMGSGSAMPASAREA
ncbi:DUF421 domain-containing protein [Leucobacter sp. USCH14]|uniref:DUF421 domain-containing protein n=1 Tax=Leucobacter sp. USCH14 TaxID=3024838 RepID=UPI0030A908FB